MQVANEKLIINELGPETGPEIKGKARWLTAYIIPFYTNIHPHLVYILCDEVFKAQILSTLQCLLLGME